MRGHVDDPIFREEGAERSIPDAADSAMRSAVGVLTPGEERAVFRGMNYALMRSEGPGDRWDLLAARYRNFLGVMNEGVIHCGVDRFGGTIRDCDRDEAVSIASAAVANAITRFDAAKGYKFSTYAMKSIYYAFTREWRHLSRRTKYAATVREADCGREGSLSLISSPADRDDPIGVDDLRRSLATLRPRERSMIEARFGLRGERPHTLDRIGKSLGLSKERSRQIEAEAMAKIRKCIDAML